MEALLLTIVVFYIIYKCHTYKPKKKYFKNRYKDEV